MSISFYTKRGKEIKKILIYIFCMKLERNVVNVFQVSYNEKKASER